MDSQTIASTLAGLWPPLLVIGGCGFARARWLRRRATQASRWPTTPGEIVHAAVHKGRTWNDVGHANGPSKPVYQGRIRYAYRVDGRRYEGSRLQFGAVRHLYRRTEAEALVAAYPVGRACSVHYNPDQPDDATLSVDVAPFLNRAQNYCAAALAVATVMAIVASRMS